MNQEREMGTMYGRKSCALTTRLRGGIAITLPALLTIALFAATAFAEGTGAEDAATMKDWGWRILNFAVIVGVLVYFLAKPLRGFLKKRIEDIAASLTDAKRARDEALSRLAQVEARLKDKDAELQSLLNIAEDNGRKEREILKAESEKMVEDVLLSARENIDAELLKAKEALRREAALMAVELAERLVKENIKKEDQERIIKEYISKVGGSNA